MTPANPDAGSLSWAQLKVRCSCGCLAPRSGGSLTIYGMDGAVGCVMCTGRTVAATRPFRSHRSCTCSAAQVRLTCATLVRGGLATWDATWDATCDATWDATCDATWSQCHDPLVGRCVFR